MKAFLLVVSDPPPKRVWYPDYRIDQPPPRIKKQPV